MNQVSRPMQILLGAVLVFAVLWFVALKPKTAVEEPIAAEPAPVAASTPRSAAGGETAKSSLGKAVESANNVAAKSNTTTATSQAQTGDETPTAGSPAATSSSSSSAPAAEAPKSGGTSAGTAKPAAASPGAEKADAKQAKKNAKQAKADQVIRSVKRDLAARRAVVVLVYSPSGKEDKILHKRIKNSIDRRGGRVRTHFINVSQVGYYDGLLAGLNLSQTPSTIVIAPNNEAKVLGGLTSTERIDRLTSQAILTPVATTP